MSKPTDPAKVPSIKAQIKAAKLQMIGAGDQRLVQCPRSVHGLHGSDGVDTNPSCSVNLRKGAWKCFVCGIGGGRRAFAAALKETGAGTGAAGKFRVATAAVATAQPTVKSCVVATYNYKDKGGKLIFQVVRYQPKRFRHRRPNGAGGWAWKLGKLQRVPYRLPELLAAPSDAPVYFVEGEKDADRLASLGLVATTTAGGAKSWKLTATAAQRVLTDRTVCIFPDNDKPGQAYAVAVARTLAEVATVKVVELPGLPPGGDVSDWLDAGHTTKELLEVVANTPVWLPPKEDLTAPPKLLCGSHAELALELKKRLPTLVFSRDAFWVYDDTEKLWVKHENYLIERLLYTWDGTAIADSDTKRLFISGGLVEGTMHCLTALVADPKFFDDPVAGVVCNNGLLIADAQGPRLIEHKPDLHLTFKLPLAYDPEAAAPRFIQALTEWFVNDGAAKVAILQEFVGLALLGQTPRFQKALLLTGGGNNGKSVFLDVCRALFSAESVAAVPIHELAQQYYRAVLAEKRLNICAELPMADLEATESYKSFVSGDPIQARNPGGRPFIFRPTAAHIFAGNTLPRVSDTSEGFFRRTLIIEFEANFAGHADFTLTEKLLAELPGIVAWAIRGAVRALRQNGYSKSAAVTAAVSTWAGESNPVKQFAEEMCCPSQTMTAIQIIYSAYSSWCSAVGCRPLSRVHFSRRLGTLGFTHRRTSETRGFLLELIRGADYRLV